MLFFITTEAKSVLPLRLKSGQVMKQKCFQNWLFLLVWSIVCWNKVK